jgi:pumilio RNA-binding family
VFLSHLIFGSIVETDPARFLDPFGNYVVQKLLDYGGPTIRDETLRRMLAENPVAISRNPYGTRVLQKIIDVATAEQRIALCSLFASRSSSEIYAMMLDANGNHVIQKLLMLCEPGDHLGFVYRAVEKDFLRIATDNYGCRIAQRCIETAPAKGGYVVRFSCVDLPLQKEKVLNTIGNAEPTAGCSH